MRGLYPSQNTTTDRFPNKTTANNINSRLTAAQKRAAEAARELARKRKTARLLKELTTRGPRYSLEVDFSTDDGESFDSPLKAVVNKSYQMRARFTQLQAEPLIQGVKLLWYLPAGWRFTDGWGRTTYDTCVSNPLVLSRRIKSPSTTIVESGFKVLCVQIY